MRKTVKVAGVEQYRGQRMIKGKGWRLVSKGGTFKATLVRRFDIGDESVAIFRVRKHPDAKIGK